MPLLVSFHVCEAKKKSRSSEVVLSCLQETLVLVHSLYLHFPLELCSAIVTMLLLQHILFTHLYTHKAAHALLHNGFAVSLNVNEILEKRGITEQCNGTTE